MAVKLCFFGLHKDERKLQNLVVPANGAGFLVHLNAGAGIRSQKKSKAMLETNAVRMALVVLYLRFTFHMSETLVRYGS